MSQARETPFYTAGTTVPVPQVLGRVSYYREVLQGYTIPQLKDILKSQGKKVGGNKAELIDRIMGDAPGGGTLLAAAPVFSPVPLAAPVFSPVPLAAPVLSPVPLAAPVLSPVPLAAPVLSGLPPVQPTLVLPTVPIQGEVVYPILPSPRVTAVPTTPLTPIVAVIPSPTGTPKIVDYNRYTDVDLVNLGRNMYGNDLGGMNRDAMIQWFTQRETIEQPPIVGAGPQAGALSPVITSPTQLPMLPSLPPALPIATTTGIPAPALPTTLPTLPAVPLPITTPVPLPITTPVTLPTLPVPSTVVTSPPTSPIQLPPMPTVVLPPVTATPQQATFPMGVLPPITLPTITQQAPVQLPPVPPTAIQAALSPQPTIQLPPIVGKAAPAPVIVGGLGPLPTELPPITAPAPALGLGTVAVPGMGITMPVVPTVVPPQAIRLPSPPSGIPTPVPVPRPANIPPPQVKVGPGGLNIDTDLATLNQLRSEINTAVNINPQAAFQKKVPAPVIGRVFLPPLPNVPLTALPQVAAFPVPTLPQPTLPVTTLPPVPTIGMTAATMPQPMVPTGITSPMLGLPPLPGITLPKGPVAPTQPTGFQPLPQIITSPTPQPAVVLPGINVVLPTQQLPTQQLPTQQLPAQQLPAQQLPAQPTATLPIGRATGVAPQIHLPKIKETAPIPQGFPQIQTPRFPGIPTVRLPTTQTVMQPVALTSPAAIPEQEETGLAVAYTPQQQVVENITQIDATRLNAGRAKKDDNSYTVVQLRAIAGSLNLAKSGNKKDLVERIKAKMLSVNPNAFN